VWILTYQLISPLFTYSVWGGIRFFKLLKTRTWGEARANVLNVSVKNQPVYGHVVEVYYKYYIDGLCYGDMHIQRFLKYEPFKRYVKRLVPGTEIGIFVKPTNPSISIVAI